MVSSFSLCLLEFSIVSLSILEALGMYPDKETFETSGGSCSRTESLAFTRFIRTSRANAVDYSPTQLDLISPFIPEWVCSYLLVAFPYDIDNFCWLVSLRSQYSQNDFEVVVHHPNLVPSFPRSFGQTIPCSAPLVAEKNSTIIKESRKEAQTKFDRGVDCDWDSGNRVKKKSREKSHLKVFGFLAFEKFWKNLGQREKLQNWPWTL